MPYANRNTNSQKSKNAQPIYIGGRQVAVLRNHGALCDIRRHDNGFLYGPHRVAMSEELLEQLSDTVVLQFTNLDGGDLWTITVHDFRHWSEPFQAPGFEPQRACEVARMNYTRSSLNKNRVNELIHVQDDPLSMPAKPSSESWQNLDLFSR